METGYNLNNGTLFADTGALFHRQSWVGLQQPVYGSLTFGRHYEPSFRIVYPTDACPEVLDSEGECPTQDYTVGTAAAHGLSALLIQRGQPIRFALRVGAGRECPPPRRDKN